MSRAKVVLIGAGSRTFGPGTVRDVLLSKPLADRGVDLVLMDTVEKHVKETEDYAKSVNERLKGSANVSSTTSLDRAIEGADAVISAIEVNRYLYWSQDFHVPRKYGFRQIFGENGGPGGAFHALRNMGPTVKIAKTMERLAPKGVLFNFTNPEHKLCEAVARLTKTPVIGLCHGVFMGMEQISRILGRPMDSIEFAASGMNHFTWFQIIRDKKTGEDLYPALRKAEREGDWLAEWHELVLSRILLRRFGLWPSPGANHIGEYLGWADEFHASQAQYFYDPADGHPWTGGVPTPEFVYSLAYTSTDRGWGKTKAEQDVRRNQESKAQEKRKPIDDTKPLKPTAELAAPIMESLFCGVKHELPAIITPNKGAIPNLPPDMTVEVPATSDATGWKSVSMPPLPEPVAAIIRLHGSIHQLLVEAYAEESKAKLLQAILLDPTVHSYRAAVQMVDEMIGLQKELLPPLK